jgi:histone deacetylase complex subunit SAP18
MFICEGRHHAMSDYTNKRTPPVAKELQIYTWLDATLSELMGLIRQIPECKGKNTQFSFSVVFPEPNSPTYRMRHVGVTICGKRGPDDEKTLSQSRLQIGDYIDVGIMPIGADMSKMNNNQGQGKKNRMRNRGGGAGGGPTGRFYR